MTDHYEVLDVPRDASARQIAKAFRRAARATHPDAGGSAAEFAAVETAWSVLSVPERRARYDALVADDGDDWDDAGWGTDESGGPATPEADAQWSPDPSSTDEWWGEDDDVPTGSPPDVGLDPFSGGPLRLPELSYPVAARRRGRGRRTRRFSWARVGVLLVVIVSLVAAVVGVPALLEAFPWLLGPRPSSSGPGFVVVVVAAAVYWQRRRADARAQGGPSAEAVSAIERHRRASAWNRVRAASRRKGSVVVAVGPRVDPRDPLRRWTWDPRAGMQTLRDVEGDLPVGVWVVLDPNGHVSATAPGGSPQAWSDLLRSVPIAGPARPRRRA